MGKPLPMALHECVAAFVDVGRGHREVACHFRVSPCFVNELMKLCRETGTLGSLRQGHALCLGKMALHAGFVRERMAQMGGC